MCPFANRLGLLSKRQIYFKEKGFTLLEVLVALFIVATSLVASLKAVGSLTQNSADLRAAIMGTWSAENRLATLRLKNEWPALGSTEFSCPQADIEFSCKQTVYSTPNPLFRRIEISVNQSDDANHNIVTLSQLIGNEL